MKLVQIKMITRLLSFGVVLYFLLFIVWNYKFESNLNTKIECISVTLPQELKDIEPDSCYLYSYNNIDFYRVDYDLGKKVFWFELNNVTYDSLLKVEEGFISLDEKSRYWKGNDMIGFMLISEQQEDIKGSVTVRCKNTRPIYKNGNYEYPEDFYRQFNVVSDSKEVVRLDFNMLNSDLITFTNYKVFNKKDKALFVIFGE